jgi:hypothetical protein
VYKPEYERIKKEAMEAKSKKNNDEDEEIVASGSGLNKDSLIEFDDGIYKSDDDEDEEDILGNDIEVDYNAKKRKIRTIPEEVEEGNILKIN